MDNSDDDLGSLMGAYEYIDKTIRVLKLHRRLNREHARLCTQFEEVDLGEKVNDLTEKYYKLIGQVLGKEEYERIYNMPIDKPVRMVNPDDAGKIDYRKVDFSKIRFRP